MDEQTIYYIIIGAFALVGAWFIYMETKFKHKVRIYEVVNNRVLIKDVKAMDFIDKDKSMWWKISGEKRLEMKLLPIPPEDCIELSSKGKKHVACYRFGSGEVCFIKNDWKVEAPPSFDNLPESLKKEIEKATDNAKKKELLDEHKKKSLDDWRTKNKIITPIKPITTNQRMSYFYNIKKAEDRKKVDWKNQLPSVVAISGLVLLVLGLMIFWGDIAQPAIKGNEQAIQAKQLDIQLVQEIRALKMQQITGQPVNVSQLK